jgi:hypothetical protein
VVLIESDRERRVGGQDELGITLAPIPKESRTQRTQASTGSRPFRGELEGDDEGNEKDRKTSGQLMIVKSKMRTTHLITAMFTGADAVAW